jgi:hypothetical protein
MDDFHYAVIKIKIPNILIIGDFYFSRSYYSTFDIFKIFVGT